MRASLRERYKARLAGKARSWTDDELRASAIVIAPHQDDETLACGATIAAKRAAGASVKIVFMTDGAGSHAHLMDPKQLSTLRRQEALAAAQVLGVPAGDVHFLGFPDGNLTGCTDAAVTRLREFLVANPAEQIFVPFRGDALADHVATLRVFHQAVAPIESNYQVYEYPVWFWHCWPWASKPKKGLKRLLAQTRDATRWTWAIRFQLRAYAMPPEAKRLKKEALAKHETQTRRWNGDSDWLTLADVSDGDFLGCFDQDFEVFYRRSI